MFTNVNIGNRSCIFNSSEAGNAIISGIVIIVQGEVRNARNRKLVETCHISLQHKHGIVTGQVFSKENKNGSSSSNKKLEKLKT